MAWFRNHYRCPECRRSWSDEWSAACDDDCPSCGERHVSPADSDDLTEIIETTAGGRFALQRSPPSAEHRPDYIEVGRFGSRAEAEAAAALGGAVAAPGPDRRLRSAATRQAIALEIALSNLRDARDQLKLADCPATLKRVRAALKSAEGAKRHMERRLVGAQP